MTHELGRHTGWSARTRRATFGSLALGWLLAMLVLASSASANKATLDAEFLAFAQCPVQTAAVCTVARTTSGEFVIGHKTVPIESPVLLQGGLATTSFMEQPLVGALDGNTLSKTPLTVPGGLVGIAGLGGEVTATAEIAGPPSSVIINRGNLGLRERTAVTLPLKVKLSNPALGEECYIGSESEPIVLHLTTGATDPPSPTPSISGSVAPGSAAKGKINEPTVSLVDNDFAVPGASGCGGVLSAVIDPVVDVDVGIPSKAGENTAIMTGPLEETTAELALKYRAKVKKPKK
jgi:hypothetical protein